MTQLNQLRADIEATNYPPYKLAARSVGRKYFKEIHYEVKAVEGDARYRVTSTRGGGGRTSHIRIYDNKNIIFMCPNEGVAPRNLYLELSGANFSISEWQIKRANKEYDNFDYSSAVSNTSSIK